MKNTLAAIDIGTNSFHLIVVRYFSDGRIKLLDNKRVFLRLGSGKKDNKSYITESDFEKAISAIRDFMRIISGYDANVRAVATSAVREAVNNTDLLKGYFLKPDLVLR